MIERYINMENNVKKAEQFAIKSMIESMERDLERLEFLEFLELIGAEGSFCSKRSETEFNGSIQDLIQGHKAAIEDFKGLLDEPDQEPDNAKVPEDEQIKKHALFVESLGEKVIELLKDCGFVKNE